MKKSICIIDDDPIYQFLMKKLLNLSKTKITLLPFNNGYDAITNFKQDLENNVTLPEIILLDIEMPVMNGWKFMKEMELLISQNKHIETKIFFVSSSISYEDIEKVNLFEHVAGYYSKPITKATINEIIAD